MSTHLYGWLHFNLVLMGFMLDGTVTARIPFQKQKSIHFDLAELLLFRLRSHQKYESRQVLFDSYTISLSLLPVLEDL
uniref:Secreted protein n=1 Tax=Panagrellus redivivus TaxID=6233 RepID=A0A7E4VRN6_PANRE